MSSYYDQNMDLAEMKKFKGYDKMKEEIMEAIDKAKTNKALGTDGLHHEIL